MYQLFRVITVCVLIEVCLYLASTYYRIPLLDKFTNSRPQHTWDWAPLTTLRTLAPIQANWSSYNAEFHKLNRALILNATKACLPILPLPNQASFDPGSNKSPPLKKTEQREIKKYICLISSGVAPLQIPQSLHISFPSRALCMLGWNTQYYW